LRRLFFEMPGQDMSSNDRSNDSGASAEEGAKVAELEVAAATVQLHDNDTIYRTHHHQHHHHQSIHTSDLITTEESSSPSARDHEQVSVNLPSLPKAVHLSPSRIAQQRYPHLHPLPPLTASSVTLNECCAPAPAQASRNKSKMGLTKTQRIGILLAIDSVFFLIELIVGEWPCLSHALNEH
jgi:hypothetical protein